MREVSLSQIFGVRGGRSSNAGTCPAIAGAIWYRVTAPTSLSARDCAAWCIGARQALTLGTVRELSRRPQPGRGCPKVVRQAGAGHANGVGWDHPTPCP